MCPQGEFVGGAILSFDGHRPRNSGSVCDGPAQVTAHAESKASDQHSRSAVAEKLARGPIR
eukprot:10635246-Alexandrium_andersonii.AAC.1